MKKHLTIKRRDALTGLLFFLPWLIGFFTVTAYPLIYSVFISFNQVQIKPGGGISFQHVGFEYYRQAFAVDTVFGPSLFDSVINLLLSVPLAVVFALIISLLLNNKFCGRAVYRMVFFLPVVIMSGPVMNALMIETSAMEVTIDMSAVYEMLIALDSAWAKALHDILLTFFNGFMQILWFSGVQMIIFLASLQKIDRAMYEAASIDGATPWESFWRITLPYLKPVILLTTVYTIVEVGTFSGDATNGRIVGTILDIAKPYSYSAALSWTYAAVLLLMMGLTFVLFKDRKEAGRNAYKKRAA
jgi:ABC-type sugar transport system permease subunit